MEGPIRRPKEVSMTINWEKDDVSALAKAKAESKVLFVDFFSPQ
jgi:hypothetical protein